MERTQLYHGLSLVLGTLIAFVMGLVGPSLASSLADVLPAELQRGGVFGLAALFVIGVVAGAFGRGVVGLLALWVGLLLAAGQALGLLPAGFDGAAGLAVALAVAAVGYAVARAVDPFWGSEPTAGPGLPPAPSPLPPPPPPAPSPVPASPRPSPSRAASATADRPAADDGEPFRPR